MSTTVMSAYKNRKPLVDNFDTWQAKITLGLTHLVDQQGLFEADGFLRSVLDMTEEEVEKYGHLPLIEKDMSLDLSYYRTIFGLCSGVHLNIEDDGFSYFNRKYVMELGVKEKELIIAGSIEGMHDDINPEFMKACPLWFDGVSTLMGGVYTDYASMRLGEMNFIDGMYRDVSEDDIKFLREVFEDVRVDVKCANRKK